MLNDAHVSITGYVVSQPKARLLPTGIPVLTLRIGWTPRRLDRSTGEWVDGNTSYATVVAWRRLAAYGSMCLRKGDPVNVVGRLSVRDFEVDGVRRTAVEVEAGSIGHDLNRGVASFSRVRPQSGRTAAEYEEAMTAKGQSDGQPPATGPDPGTAGMGPESAEMEWQAGGTGGEPDDGDDLAALADVVAGPAIAGDEDDLDEVPAPF